MNQALREKLLTLPNRPGVYFHKSADGEVIYVGKAAVLRNRVRSYFRGAHDTKTTALVQEIADTDWIETDSEIDALFLESEMVKRYMPRYNILLRDDKSSTYVRIPFQDELPMVTTSRNPADDGAEYFGPFYNGGAVKMALRHLRRVFPFFARKTDFSSKLLRQLGLTPDSDQPGEYKKNLRSLARYLRGERVKIQAEMEKEMQRASKNLEFERAAHIRNQLRYMNELRRQTIFARDEFMDASKDQALVDLKKLLNLVEIPRRIEAYDISHQSGRDVVASMAVATNGVADRREYRKFRLRVQKNDDVAALREVLSRRFSDRHRGWARPDLVILDGGKPQLSAVREILTREEIPYFGRNKSGDHGRNAAVNVVIPEGDGFREVSLDRESHIAKLVARIDEEAHRFALSYHENLKSKRQTKNILEEIPGVGAVTRKKLLRHFGSVTKLREMDQEKIAEIVGEKLAATIRRYLG
jgi:excinuclease ABC subunit C